MKRKPRIYREDGLWIVSLPGLHLRIYFPTWREAIDYALTARIA